ncbi:hypothetical protein DY000_02016850 [Brassica cretica]|uniref:Uncharacterized protein n=1 Tax=Brassica cretica TaxID=69181 RepID=A0ABQ7CR11_BRACR|nr:hypothetical protein DY000_02016850 [Brassica cretica]
MWVLVCDQGFVLFCSYFDALMSKTQINEIDLFFLYRFRQTVPSHSVSSISSKTNVPLHSVGAEIVKRALSYPLKLTAKNAGVNGSVVSEKVLAMIKISMNMSEFMPFSGCEMLLGTCGLGCKNDMDTEKDQPDLLLKMRDK